MPDPHRIPAFIALTRRGLARAALAALSIAAVPLAQALTPPQPKVATPPPLALPRFVVPAGAGQPIELRHYRQDTEVIGRSVLTRLTLQFHNPNPRVLEGELQFPLPDGAVVSGFSLDIDGQLRRAVPVEKAKGLQVFEDTIRGRIDPALLEATAGNQYKLRVYPLPPNGQRTVVMDLVQALPPGTANELRLPFGFDGGAARAELSLKLAGVDRAGLKAIAHGLPAGTLQVDAGAPGGTRLLIAPRALKQPVELQLRYAAPAAAPVQAAAFDGQHFVYAELPVPAIERPRAAPKRIALVWDASGSGAQRQRAAEWALLDAVFARWPSVQVQLHVLRDRLEPARAFSVRGGDWTALRQAIEAEPFDGATQLGAINLAAGSADLALVFSDGQSTFGAPTPPVFGLPAFVLQSAIGSAPAALRAAVEPQGGAVLDLLSLPAPRAAHRIAHELPRLIELRSRDGAQWVAASRTAEHGRLAVAGIAHAAEGVLEARFELPGRGVDVQRVRWSAAADTGAATLPPVGVPPGTALPDDDSSPPLPALRWATLKLDALAGQPKLHQREIQRIGQRFGLATPETSLIVLDNLADYVRHGIEPPAGPLRTAWHQQRTTVIAGEQRQQRDQIEHLVRRFRERQSWWATSFPKDDPAIARKREADTATAAIGALQERAEARRDLAAAAGPREAAKSAEAARPAAPAAPVAQAAAVAPVAPPAPMAMPSALAAAPALRGAANATADARQAPAGGEAAPAAIALARWQPDTPSARRLRAAAPKERYAVYLDERPQHLKSTAFFLDAADLFFQQGDAALGVRVLSNLAEMELENRSLLRILGYRLLQAERAELAVPVFERVLAIAPHEPQSSRDLGLALADAQRWQGAADALWQAATHRGNLQGRFPDIDLTAVTELNALVAKAARAGKPVDTAAMDPRLLVHMPLGLRVVLGWDADNTDIDLHVVDPDGEEAFYGRPRTRQGGRMSADFTGGYGPEEFALRSPKPGVYSVRARFYGHRQQVLAPATTLMLRLVTGFGTAAEKEQRVMLRLSGSGEDVRVGEFRVGAFQD
ncbi:VIT domain-containing protein [Aquabacterium humicola]|uniref:VIT domain-containing protein n=1 Tax=Aquabacterium humicola TaxID=3237377 RepID=UPI002543651E|nr:VIT domain-containing protein [Rubrivivax pictus]